MIQLKEKEEIIEVVKKSLFILVGPFLKALLLISPTFYFLFYLDNQILNVISFAWILVIASYLFYHILNWHLDYFVISNFRIIEVENKGFFSRQITEMPLERIDNSKSKTKGIFATIFGYGDVTVYSIAKADITLDKIPEPIRIQGLISEVKEEMMGKMK